MATPQVNKSASASASMKSIKPLKTINTSEIKCGDIKTNPEYGTKWSPITYIDDKQQLLLVAPNCTIKTCNTQDNKDKDNKDNKDKDNKNDKARPPQLFVGINDNQFKDEIKKLEAFIKNYSCHNSEKIFGEQFNEEEVNEMFKQTLLEHEKYGTAIGAKCSYGYNVISKTPAVEVPSDNTKWIDILTKSTKCDICFLIKQINVGVGKFSIGIEIKQINITEAPQANAEWMLFVITPDNYDPTKLIILLPEQHPKGGKFAKAQYDGKTTKFKIANANGRIFKNENPGQEPSYSISIRLDDPAMLELFKKVDVSIFNHLLSASKDFFGAKKTPKLLSAILKPVVSYNKADQDKIKKGEQPTYAPSIWIKLYNSVEKGFDNKLFDANKKTFINNDNIAEYINKNINLSVVEFYIRQIFSGPKGVSVSFVGNKLFINMEGNGEEPYDLDIGDDDAIVNSVAKVAINSDEE